MERTTRSAHLLVLSLALVPSIIFPAADACAQGHKWPFVPPPRTIADITAILDEEKPDPKVAARMHGDAAASPPTHAGRAELAKFHYNRCIARSTLGEFRTAIADCETAVSHARGSLNVNDLTRLRYDLGVLYSTMSDPKKALEIWLSLARDVNVKGSQGWLFSIQRNISGQYIRLGDFNQAELYVRRSQRLMQQARGWSTFRGYRGAMWNADIEAAAGRLFEARGQFREAEASYRRTELSRREALRLVRTYEALPPAPDALQQLIDHAIALQGLMKGRQGRTAEGEADIRRALLSRLKATGKYNLRTVNYIGFLADQLVEQGRFAEAERLTRAQLDVLHALGLSQDADKIAAALNQLGSILNLQGRWKDAANVYSELDEATKSWVPARREALSLNISQIATLYNANNLAAGIAAAERLLERNRSRLGEQHMDTALARGMLAIGLGRSGQDGEALREFKLAIPILVSASRETDSDDAMEAAAREQRAQIVIEAYIALLAQRERAKGVTNTAAAAETFPLADVIRGHSVQKALAASSARAVARNAELAELARKVQDLDKQVAAQLGALNNALALPPEQRDDKALKTLHVEIDRLRAARDAAKRDIASRFREYASLVEPQPPSVDDIRAVLKPDEAFLSFYFGRDASFVWAVPKTGAIQFAVIPLTAGLLEDKVTALRAAFDPQAQGATIEDMPPFNLALAYELYAALLKPVEAAWRPAKNLIVVTNGALGLLPLSLLPTDLPQGDLQSKLLFDEYRHVPWLARTHAVSQVPSAAALRTLRQLPPGHANRDKLIGFGDPIFSAAQAVEAQNSDEHAVQVAGRGNPLKRRAQPQTIGVDSADLALLPRLPDTADELKAVALALQADPTKVLYLGKKANEQEVKRTDLSRFRIVAFATHGLVPGDLNGLTQPALALTAPDVADVDGDGLLTMEEILSLRLDADWVVLSACNTAAGLGVGAEVASGLGRAFFYAGSRALLVTNWSVDSASARQLVADLFRRQAANAGLSRAEALRQAMMALMDGPGYSDAGGKTLFSYAHPLFWAPYTIIGDGGARN
jgi:CHAT domain-containing protein